MFVCVTYFLLWVFYCCFYCISYKATIRIQLHLYRGADKSVARPGRKQATATEDFDVHIFNIIIDWRNIGTIYLFIYIYIYIYITRLA